MNKTFNLKKILKKSISISRNFQFRSIKYKIIAVLVFLIFALVTVNMINNSYYRSTISKYEDIINTLVKENSIMVSTMDIRQTLREIIIDCKNTEKLEGYKEYKNNMSILQKEVGSSTNKEVAASRKALFVQMNKFIEVADNLVKMAGEYDARATDEYNNASKIGDYMRESSIELSTNELKYSQILIKQIGAANNLTQKISYTIIIVVVLICLFLTFFTTRNIINSLNKLINVSEKIADGKLSTKQCEVNSKDEIGKLASSVNIMQQNLFKMVKLISANGNHMHTTLASLDNFIHENSVAGQQLVAAFDTVAKSADEEADLIKHTLISITDINESIKNIYDETELVISSADTALSKAIDGESKLKKVISQTILVQGLIDSISLTANELYEYSIKISNITKFINGISTQTNLLALNASIEAARAGEAGRGFAVVAGQVKTLAEQSNQSSGEIKNVIENIKQLINNMKLGIEKSVEEIKSTASIINEETKAFNEIVLANQTVNNQILSINKRLDAAKYNIGKINETSSSVANIATELLDNSKQAQGTIEHQVATQENFAQSASELKDMSIEFSKVISNFHLEE
ncbi:methyl-accepting chemotaxis protein [Acetivibrio cellulolyticus]|uniref:methyl-accepting chemotaxis protein n=1 Tax=Acetivibrio cellulolyticus TaxID=35830 RepID=UPI0001E2F0A2|nr:methyl-accepting chemotaxis protein [Acetivibrio cellulolyticus]